MLGALIDQRGDERVARQSIACGHQQDAGAVLLQPGKRRAEARALVGWSSAPNCLIGKYIDQLAVVSRAPRDQGAPLCLRTQCLVAGAYPDVANDLPRVARRS